MLTNGGRGDTLINEGKGEGQMRNQWIYLYVWAKQIGAALNRWGNRGIESMPMPWCHYCECYHMQTARHIERRGRP